MNRDKHNLNQTDDEQKSQPNPIENASILSKATFWWTKEIFKKGSKQYDDTDIYLTRKQHTSKHIYGRFDRVWKDELQKPQPSMLRAIYNVYGPNTIMLGLIFSLQETAIRIAQPLCLGGLVSYFAPGQAVISERDAYLYATGIILCALLPVLTFHPFIYFIMQVGMKIRIGCSGLLYSKALRLSKSISNDGVGGKLANLLTNDVGRFDIALCFIHDLWKGPLEALLLGFFIYLEIGISGVIGLAFLLSFIPLQAYVGKMAATYRMKTAKRTDVRVKLMNEIIHGIQVIKMYVWENSFAKMVENVRRKEINAVRGSAYIRATLSSFFMISRFSIFLSLVTYVYFGNVITARKVFIVSSFYNILNESMVHFWPMAITCCAEGYISVKRIQEFMLIKEQITPSIGSSANGVKNGVSKKEKPENGVSQQNGSHVLLPQSMGIHMEHVTADWQLENDETATGIKDVTFKATEPNLCVIIGTVGSGKSTFLTVLLKELPISSGKLAVNGTISYAAQEAWLFNGSVKSNILFIEEYDEKRYREVVEVCALEKDFEILMHGDETIVGEKGVTLSGGQKARINLARAIYRKADIYLLDDPLSAVDSNVGKHIFDRCIRKFLKDKICVLVTHQLQYLKHVPHIVLMQAGKVEAQGTYNELISSKLYLIQSLASSTEGSEVDGDTNPNEPVAKADIVKNIEHEKQDEVEEQQTTGTVTWAVYKTYFKAVNSYFYTCVIFLLFVLGQVAVSSVDYFVAQWVNWEESIAIARQTNSTDLNISANLTDVDPHESERMRYIYIYAALMGICIYLTIHKTFAFFHLGLGISKNLHDKLFRGITRAKMYFFNTNPSGRIINRFANDIGSIDTKLPSSLNETISFFLELTAVVVIIGIVNYWLLLPTVIMSVVLFGLRKIYVTTSRSVKRIESLTRSPIYSHTNASLQGITTIRAFDAQDILLTEFHDTMNKNTSLWFVFLSITRAFAFWLDMSCVIYIACVTYTFLLMKNDTLGGNVGLAIMQVMSLIGMCQWGMRQTAELENQMISVERVIEYSEVDPETPLLTEEQNKLSAEWPKEGCVEFSHVKLRYSEASDYVLKDISFRINSNEKIGIVGRTGAGKSSLIQALFHLASVEGDIIIDGVNTRTLGLYDIRKKISIIPQDPVLFSGTVRSNLDPFEEMADDELWNALELVELKEFISSFAGGLNARISDDGSNFSMGQRQLVCLARAILKKNKILVLDEATANVDPETDQLIQNTIKTQFADCTVFTIAHRLHTVIDSDRVMVMEAGKLVEFGHSHELLHRENGFFRSLVDHTGGATANKLMGIAESSFTKSKAE